MARQPTSVPIALMLFIVSALVAYWVFSSHGWPAIDLVTLWRNFPTALRAVVVGTLIANAWGLGALLDALLRRRG
jgi:hypothetical protein